MTTVTPCITAGSPIHENPTPLAPPIEEPAADEFTHHPKSPRPETFDLASGALAPRAKTKPGKDAGRAHSGAMGPTEDTAGRRFAAAGGRPSREIGWRGPCKEES